jgi:hypothetical protein
VTRYRRQSRDSNEGSLWRCVKASFGSVHDLCDFRSVRQEFIEYNFMMMLQHIKNRPDFRRLVENEISKLALTEQEHLKIEELKNQVDGLNQKLYQMVDKELNDDGLETVEIDSLTSEIIKLKDEIQALEDREEQADNYKQQLNELMKQCEVLEHISFRKFHNMVTRIKSGDSIYKTTRNAKDKTYLKKKITDYFRNDLFKRYITKGIIDHEGKIQYEFIFGINYGVDMSYQDYIITFEDTKAKINAEELLKSMEGRKLKEFCMTPKRVFEMKQHLNIESKNSFYKRIFIPLKELGKLKPVKSEKNYQMYIWCD